MPNASGRWLADPRDILAARSQLAATCRLARQFGEAIALCQRNVADWTRLSTPEDFDVLTECLNLGRLSVCGQASTVVVGPTGSEPRQQSSEMVPYEKGKLWQASTVSNASFISFCQNSRGGFSHGRSESL